jgi:hypothetical protein
LDIDENVRLYLQGSSEFPRRGAEDRYASFDYCYNYFQSFRDRACMASLAESAHLQQSCLHIGFYLASWGMLRGSTFLLQKSQRFLVPLVRYIAEAPPSVWGIDVDCYEDNLGQLMDCYRQIEGTLRDGGPPTPTLVTKIMLGVFGTVPAFDNYFMSGMGIRFRGAPSLLAVVKFYRDHRAAIDAHHVATFTLDFASGHPTHRHYPRAKIVDMVGFIEGLKKPQPHAA